MDYGTLIFENAGDPSPYMASSYAFVGLYAVGEKRIFRLPLGYPQPEKASCYEVARDLHIMFFKLFRRFRAIAERNRERPKKTSEEHEDAGPALEKGREWIARHTEGDVYYYRHFDAFDSLLDAFDELMILGLEQRLRLTECPPADLRNFQRTAAGRIYQDDDSFYDDTSLQSLPTVTLLSSDLVGLYCFLLCDLREHVWAQDDPDPLQDDIRVLGERFLEKHLWPDASCWESEQWNLTRIALRDKLDVIDRVTALKDEDYYKLRDAVERFLYPPADDSGQTGMLWGLDGFWPVWEWMVLTRLASEPEFCERLYWIEADNLAQETVDQLKSKLPRHPNQDQRVLCRDDGSWDTFLENGWKVGHPFPDAILAPAELQKRLNIRNDTNWNWIDTLILKEGPVTMSLSGMSNQLAVSKSAPFQVQFRRQFARSSQPISESEELRPILEIMDEKCINHDRPELTAMLRLLGHFGHGEGAVGRYKPFKSLIDIGRKHFGGVLLVDAKYKTFTGKDDQWANDHRKQGAYEDVLTLSCPETPAAYSIYICPGVFATKELRVNLSNRVERKKQFVQEFNLRWNGLNDAAPPWRYFKNASQTIQVFGRTATVDYGQGQFERAYGKLIPEELKEDCSAEMNKSHIAFSLLGVDRFPGNDNFFVKNWPIRDLVDEMVKGN